MVTRISIQSLFKKCPCSELFWSAFSHIQTEYGKILRISPYSIPMRGNTDQNNSECGISYAVNISTIKFNLHFLRQTRTLTFWKEPSHIYSAFWVLPTSISMILQIWNLVREILTLRAPIPQNGRTHSNNSSAVADKLFECVWPFCGVGT